LLYAITDRRLYAEKKADAMARLVDLAAMWAASGVSFIQLREKDLSGREQVDLARAMLLAIHAAGSRVNRDEDAGGATRVMRVPRLLIHGRADVALAAGADGVHLPAGSETLTPAEVRSIFAAAGRSQAPVVSVSCHTVEEVQLTKRQSPDCILLAPVFEKMIREKDMVSDAEESRGYSRKLPGTGLALLQQACRAAAPVHVFALGGVTADNAADCIRAGAAGIAAIRLLQEPPFLWKHLV
jgi:thiamine-phosphate pyrophosphorylase